MGAGSRAEPQKKSILVHLALKYDNPVKICSLKQCIALHKNSGGVGAKTGGA